MGREGSVQWPRKCRGWAGGLWQLGNRCHEGQSARGQRTRPGLGHGAAGGTKPARRDPPVHTGFVPRDLVKRVASFQEQQ